MKTLLFVIGLCVLGILAPNLPDTAQDVLLGIAVLFVVLLMIVPSVVGKDANKRRRAMEDPDYGVLAG
jgi:hypothetical protein